jgi:homoserine kinase
MTTRVTVKVPATTANLGPGFDCLGMALDIWNTVTAEVGEPGFVIRGEGKGTLSQDASNLVQRCLRIPFEESGRQVPDLSITCENDIPLARGLGSSSAAVVAGLAAGNELCGRPLAQTELLVLAHEVEGHPDNVTPALLGGCQIVVQDGERLVTSPVPIPNDLQAVLYIPDVAMPTEEARELLPDKVSRKDAVYNMGRVGMLVAALSSGDLSDLAVATQDSLHQPARQTIFPPMKVIFRAALDAGALGVFLSGAGSSVLALTRGKEMTIGYEMADAASKAGLTGSVRITRPVEQGAHVVPNAP